MDLDLFTTQESPFDTIKQTRQDGSEYWSARELFPLLGYTRWENFETPLNRAITAARNQGHQVETLFLRSQEISGGRPRVNYHLTRFAAYLVAMNGDPNMEQVAAAQAYFAIQTRVAETTPARELTGPELMAKTLFDQAGISRHTFDRSMAGGRSFTVVELMRFASVLGIHVSEILGPELTSKPMAAA